MSITLLHGDCREQLQSLIDQGVQVDSIVTDPPYEMGFMNKSWDGTGVANDVDMWKLCLKALKPGGHLLSFGGTRTYHRMTCAIEDAGFEIRDCVNWIYGSGFPKSLRLENGFGTALKPAHEPIVLARKPLSENNIASNVLKHGVGGINIDGCRVGDDCLPEQKAGQAKIGTFIRENMVTPERTGRFPANIIHDGSEEVESSIGHGSRFFYSAKASKRERNIGLDTKEQTTTDDGRAKSIDNPFQRGETLRHNNHPTVKPISLMKYLCRLITPPGGTVLDPFLGSGSTGIAAKSEGFSFIGIEKEADYMEIAKARIGGSNERESNQGNG